MLRISKLTDYATLILSYLALVPDNIMSAAAIAAEVHLSLPTVSKLLKILLAKQLVISRSGSGGGYKLARPADKITLEQVVSAIEGQIAMTECCSVIKTCALDSLCTLKENWQVINQSILANQKNVMPMRSDCVTEILEWAKTRIEKIESFDIASERIIFDVGIGFGKTAEQSMHLLKHIAEFKQLGVRLLVGHSRKSFLQLYTAHEARDRDIETIALSLGLLNQVDYLRVHDVDGHARAFKAYQTRCSSFCYK